MDHVTPDLRGRWRHVEVMADLSISSLFTEAGIAGTATNLCSGWLLTVLRIPTQRGHIESSYAAADSDFGGLDRWHPSAGPFGEDPTGDSVG